MVSRCATTSSRPLKMDLEISSTTSRTTAVSSTATLGHALFLQSCPRNARLSAPTAILVQSIPTAVVALVTPTVDGATKDQTASRGLHQVLMTSTGASHRTGVMAPNLDALEHQKPSHGIDF